MGREGTATPRDGGKTTTPGRSSTCPLSGVARGDIRRCGRSGRCRRDRFCLGDGAGDRADADALLRAAIPFELHRAIHGREERVVAAAADIGAGIELRAPLAHDNRARAHVLAVVALHVDHLRFAVASVTRAADTLFMCHVLLILCSRESVEMRLAPTRRQGYSDLLLPLVFRVGLASSSGLTSSSGIEASAPASSISSASACAFPVSPTAPPNARPSLG